MLSLAAYMTSILKARILDNRFILRLRNELLIDRNAFASLCADLRALAEEWREAEMVDKELVQELYILAPVTWNVGRSFVGHNPEVAAEIEDLGIELDALVLECLNTNRS